MKIVIKPIGLILIILTITALTAFTIVNYQKHAMQRALREAESNGVLLQTFGDAEWRLDNESKDATILVTLDPNAPGANNSVLRATVKKANPHTPYLVRASKSVPQTLPAKHKIRLSIWAKSRTSSPVTLLFEEGKPPYTKDFNQELPLTPKWKKHVVTFETKRAYGPNEAQIRLILGAKTGEFEFSGLELSGGTEAADTSESL
jgi:hypothetical protein